MKTMDLAAARRCVSACARYLRERDESPRAATDLEQAVAVIEQHAKRQQTIAMCQHEPSRLRPFTCKFCGRKMPAKTSPQR